MTLRPYKFVVQAIVQELDDEGAVVGEHATAEPATVFGCEALEQWARDFPKLLEDAVTEPPQ